MESRLGSIFRTLTLFSKQTPKANPPSIENAKLPKIAESIRVDRVQTKKVVDKNLLLKWKTHLQENRVSEMSDREIRRLAWEPDISLSNEYATVLNSRNLTLRRSLAKGLVYSILSSWNTVGARRLKDHLEENVKSREPLPYLLHVQKHVLDEKGHELTASKLIDKMSNVSTTITNVFGIAASSSSYANFVLASVVESGYLKVLSNVVSERKWFYSEILQHVNKETLMRCLERVVSAIDQNRNEPAKDEFKRFILFHPHLGDPRLPGYEGNWPKGKITDKVIEWLSQSDIRFFFELFIEKQSDRQGRKQFWLRYAHLVKGTRVIVSAHDQKRLARQIAEMKEEIGTSNLFADLRDYSEKATAFMMDFGRVIIVEFSLAGHACYYYEIPGNFKYFDRTQFWGTKRFSISELKNKALCEGSLTHRENWEQNFMNTFARLGLRPR